MNPPLHESDRQIVGDVLPEPIEDLAVPVELTELAPWHRPRKQWVRESQWITLSRRLISRELHGPGLPRPASGKPEVRYLTLPGIDYLDVRELADVCGELDCCLTSTGFQLGGEGNRLVARAELREKSLIDAGYITDNSHTYARRFQEIASPNGQALRDLRRRGPFHIVNIDACGSIAPPSANHPQRLIDAFFKTVELQLELKASRWLLFLTADARPDSIANATMNSLCEAIRLNAQESEDFRRRARGLLHAEELDIETAMERASETVGEEFLRLFSLGIAKWLLALGRQRRWAVKTHRPCCYTTMPEGDETPSMACLAFEFIPPDPGLSDPFEVSRARPTPPRNLQNMSVLAANAVSDIENADTRMKSDDSLRGRMAKRLRALLLEAGYPQTVLQGIDA